MECSERRVGEVVVLDLKGKLTIGSGDVKLRGTVHDLLERGECRILLNLGGITYMDSAGTGELVASYKSAQDAGASLKLLNLTARTRDLLQIHQLSRVFESFDDEARAVSSFGN